MGRLCPFGRRQNKRAPLTLRAGRTAKRPKPKIGLKTLARRAAYLGKYNKYKLRKLTEKKMKKLRRIAALFLAGCLLFSSVPASALETASAPDAEDWTFDQAREYMRLEVEDVLVVLGVPVGTVAGGAALARLLDWPFMSSDLVKEVAKLRVPLLKHSKTFLEEKALLEKEARAVAQLQENAMRELDRWMEWQTYSSRYNWGEWAQERLTKLDARYDQLYGRFLDRQDALVARIKDYKRAYKTFQRTGKMTLAARGAETAAVTTSSRIVGRAVNKVFKGLPLVILIVWALSAADESEREIARRFAENPALAAKLSDEQEQTVRNSPVLSEIYMRVARGVYELSHKDRDEAQEQAQIARKLAERELKGRLAEMRRSEKYAH